MSDDSEEPGLGNFFFDLAEYNPQQPACSAPTSRSIRSSEGVDVVAGLATHLSSKAKNIDNLASSTQ